jgi:tetratricopeptide (TPR) repeat protein
MAKKIKPPRDPKAEKAERKAEKAAALAETQGSRADDEAKKAEEEAAAAAAQDEFQARGVELADHVHDHPGKVLAILGSLVAAGLALGIYTAVGRSDNAAASAAYRAALEVSQAPLASSGTESGDEASPAQEGKDAGDKPKFTDANARTKAAHEQFVAVATKYRGTGAGALSWLSAGHAALKLGNLDEAVKAYDAFLFSAKDNDPLRFAGWGGLAAAREGKGDEKGAIEAFEKLVLLPDAVGEDDALLQLGRLYAKTGESDKARDSLERLKANFPDSPSRSRADEILAGLGPRTSPPQQAASGANDVATTGGAVEPK